MKVLLIYPDLCKESVVPKRLFNIEPLGLEYLAGTIPQQDVKILDMKMERNWEREIEEFQPEAVGISGKAIHCFRMLEVLKKVKEFNPKTLTMVGGPHATLMPADFNQPCVDVIVLGHRVNSFKQVIENFEKKRSFDEIEGLALPKGKDRLFFTQKNRITSLDHLPLPRRDLTEKHRQGYFHLLWRPTALLVTSAGCPYRCNFCPCPVLSEGRFLKRSPELVLEELSLIKEEYIFAGDDNFFFDYQHALILYHRVKDAKIKKKYYVFTGVNEINRHPDIVEKWAEIGLKKVLLGLESFRDKELEALNKKSTVEKNNQAIEILHQNKIDPSASFIIRPDYKKESFDALLKYIDRMKIYYSEFAILTPYPGTEFYDKVKDRLTVTDNRFFDLAHSVLPTELPLAEFYKLYLRLYRKAISPVRALKIKPINSPFAQFGFLRFTPKLFDLFHSSKKAYRDLVKTKNSKFPLGK